MTGENPRWTLCRKALGREPKAYDFILWLSPMWQKFHKAKGHKGARLVCMDCDTASLNDAFDAFLRADVAALIA